MNIKSETKQKILLLLLSGVALSLSKSPKGYFKIIKSTAKAWKEIDRAKLVRAVREFYKQRVIDYKEDENGMVNIILTKNGQQRVLRYQIDEMRINKPAKWDGKWRVVTFDVPEKNKNAREALRNKLKELGFKELQKSVFIYPFECENEIDFIVEVFDMRRYVRFFRVNYFTNQEQFELEFKLY